MRKTILGITAGLVLGAGTTWLVLRQPADAPAPATVAAPAPAKANPLQVSPAQRAAAGITLAKPATVTLTPVVEAFGRVLDAAPFIALAAEVQTAQAALTASEKELARAKQLFAGDTNVSAQSVEAAEAAAARDRVALASARARLVAGWGRALADGDQGAILAALEKGRALARLDVLPGDASSATPATAQVGPAAGGPLVAAEVLGPAPVADPQIQGTGYLVLLGNPAPPAGAALRATLPATGEATSALVVPRSAVIYHQGSAWIYVLGEENTFERKVVTLGRAVGEGVVILTGVEEGDQVVTAGAQQLLSAELQAGGSGEDEG